MPDALYVASTWVIPVILAITLYEAAHAFVARYLGDETASKLGRVSLDPVGTILLPGLLMLARSPFVFGYAKPVPVVPRQHQ
jgi:Zn-dependent protease